MMHAELEQIDTEPLDALMKLKRELEQIETRLQAMEARKAEVTEAVYLRVRSDYETRRRGLEQEAAPLKSAAREQYTKLYALLLRSEAAHEAARLDREEIEFRHSLGEFDDEEFTQRIGGVDEQLQAHTAVREQALGLRQRFVDAFRSEDDLKGGNGKGTTPRDPTSTQPLKEIDAPALPAAVTAKSSEAAPVEPAPIAPAAVEPASTQPMKLLDQAPPAPAIVTTQPLPVLDPATIDTRDLDPAATRAMKILKSDPAPARNDHTVMIRSARLVPQNAAAGKLTHMVGLRPFTLGSAEQCDVRIPGASAQHAQIKVGMAGFGLSDLGGGVRVNGTTIDQHLLNHDDIVEVGPARFVFRET